MKLFRLMTTNPADGGNDWIPNSGWKWKYLLVMQWPMRDLGEVEWNVSSPTSPLYYSRASQFESWLQGHSLETLWANQSSLALVRSQAEILTACWGARKGRRKNYKTPSISLPHLFPSPSDLNALHVLSQSCCTCCTSLTICPFLSGFILLAVFFYVT